MGQMMSGAASEILAGLQEALLDVQGASVHGLKKTVVYRIQPQEVRKSLAMSQQEFSRAFGIPLAMLQNWEQGRRQMDVTAASYLRTIARFPKEAMAAQM